MTTPAPLALLLGSLLLLTPFARADEIRLKDGRVLYGKVTENKADATLSVETRDGTVLVVASEVVQRVDDAQLRVRLRELARGAGDSPFAHLQLATNARDWGLTQELWQHLDAAVADPQTSSQALQNRLQDFLGQLEPELLPRKWRAAETDIRVRELVQRQQKSGGAGRRAALLELLRREPNADKGLRQEARRNADAGRRMLALEALIVRGTAGNDAFAWRTAILDRDEDVRTAACDLAVQHGINQGAVQYLAPGLMHSSAAIRIRTAEAFGRLRDNAAIKLLVLAGPNAGKALAAADPGVRAHVAFLQQQAYIRDFDVEVAQASFIADPKIGILQSGSVLDVTVAGVTEEIVHIVRAMRTSLQHLAGSDPGADPRAWASWLMQQQSQAPAPATQPAPTSPSPGPTQPGARDGQKK